MKIKILNMVVDLILNEVKNYLVNKYPSKKTFILNVFVIIDFVRKVSDWIRLFVILFNELYISFL